MIALPEPYRHPPQGIGPVGFMVWLVRWQWTTVLQGIVCDVVWLLGLALTPWAIGRAIDEGLIAGDYAAFLRWLGVVVWLQLQHALIQGLRDRAGITNFVRGVSRVDQVLVHASTRATIAADRKVGAGGIITMASADGQWLAFLTINVGTFVSSLAAYITVGVLLLRDSVLLALLVLIAVPVFSLLQVYLIGLLRAREKVAREATKGMNAVATDSVRGIRVIRGIGGEEWFQRRFRERSERVRDAQKRIAMPVGLADATGVLIAGVLVVGLTWIGAVMVARGEVRVGELVAFFGYAGFIVLPVRLFNQVIRVVVRAMIGARAIVELRDIAPLWVRDEGVGRSDAALSRAKGVLGDAAPRVETAPPRVDIALRDERTGLELHRGELLGVVVRNSVEAQELVDRLARLAADTEDRVWFDGSELAEVPIVQVRQRIVASDPVPFLFSGSLREVLDPWARSDDEAIRRSVNAVDGGDIVAAVPNGLDAFVGERGVEFSGGQRQRLGAARALLSDAEVLVLHEPTSAVDASTEGRMAAGIRAHRHAHLDTRAATVIVTSSPLVLSVADRVLVISGSRVTAEGTHEELVRSDAEYRRAVLRAEGVS